MGKGRRVKHQHSAFLADEGLPGAPPFWPMHHRPGTMDRMHWHGHLEVLLLTGGKLTYDLHGREIELPAHRIAMFWAFFPHRVSGVSGDGEIYVLNVPAHRFRAWSVSSELRRTVMGGSMVLSADESPYGEQMMQTWLEDGRQPASDEDSLTLSEIGNMVRRIDAKGWIVAGEGRGVRRPAGAENGANKTSDRVWQMLRFIDQHYMEDISVVEVAAEAGLHPNYAMTIFREEMNTTIANYITQVRLTEAQHLLLATRKKIYAVAMEAGFGSQSRFFTIFKQRFGTTPTQYRKRSASHTLPGYP